MSKYISRESAFQEIEKVLKKDECLVCWLNKNAEYVLNVGKHTRVVLTKYPRNWGQILVLLNSHKTSISDLTEEEWIELSLQAKKAAVIIEKILKPSRCYIVSLGASDNLLNTCPHIHFNIIPVYNKEDKPADILTWEKGVVAADESEWQELFQQFKNAWK